MRVAKYVEPDLVQKVPKLKMARQRVLGEVVTDKLVIFPWVLLMSSIREKLLGWVGLCTTVLVHTLFFFRVILEI